MVHNLYDSDRVRTHSHRSIFSLICFQKYLHNYLPHRFMQQVHLVMAQNVIVAYIQDQMALHVHAPCGLRELWFFVRIGPIRFLAGCRKRRLNQG